MEPLEDRLKTLRVEKRVILDKLAQLEEAVSGDVRDAVVAECVLPPSVLLNPGHIVSGNRRLLRSLGLNEQRVLHVSPQGSGCVLGARKEVLGAWHRMLQARQEASGGLVVSTLGGGGSDRLAF